MNRKSEMDRLRQQYHSKKYTFLGVRKDIEVPEADDWRNDYDFDSMRMIVFSEKLKVFYIDEI